MSDHVMAQPCGTITCSGDGIVVDAELVARNLGLSPAFSRAR
jgi:hypothetical protein